ncbi:MAG: hypothetical protein ACI808_001764 [Paraglaciecola sp.]
MEVGSLSGPVLAQGNQIAASQQVSRNEEPQRQVELETPASQQNAPQSGERVGSIINTQV